MINKSQAPENYFGKENFKITLKIFNSHDLCRNLEITQKAFLKEPLSIFCFTTLKFYILCEKHVE